MIYLFILFSALQTAIAAGLDLQSQSLLLYMDELKDQSTLVRGSNPNSTDISLSKFCDERKYNWTVYYRMVYFRFCNSSSANLTDFEQFCFDLQSYQSEGAEKSLALARIKRTAEENQVFDSGHDSTQTWLAHQSCGYIQDYFSRKSFLEANRAMLGNTTQDDFRQPNYTEWFIHTVPFSLPVACGFTRQSYDGLQPTPSASQCLPSSYKTTLYALMAVDSLLLLLTTLANIFILFVTPRLKIAKTPHGYFVMSLAVADLFTSIVIGGSISNTYTVYFTAHVFNINGQKVRAVDYYSQEYIDSFGFISVLSLAASIFLLVVISADRYIAIHKPMLYALHIREMKSYVILTLVVVWSLSFFIAILPLFIPDMHYTFTSFGLIIAPDFFIAYIALLGTSLLCVWCLNVSLYVSVKRRPILDARITANFSMSHCSESAPTQVYRNRYQKRRSSFSSTLAMRIRSSLATVDESLRKEVRDLSRQKRMELSLATTVRYIVLAFSFALIPPIIAMVTGQLGTVSPQSKSFAPLAKTVWSSFAYISSRILFSNSFINCLIYSARNKEFRAMVKKAFAKIVSFRDRQT